MQRVTNCVLKHNGKILLLQKPRRGWWVAPGGKMEHGESVRDAVRREFWEETGITIHHPAIRGIFTFLMINGEEVVSEWMMFTFQTEEWEGKLLEHSPEGNLSWVPIDRIAHLDMAEGDRTIFEHIIKDQGVLYGTFRYTQDFQLISSELQSDAPEHKGDDT